jgi:hypothetical protein
LEATSPRWEILRGRLVSEGETEEGMEAMDLDVIGLMRWVQY